MRHTTISISILTAASILLLRVAPASGQTGDAGSFSHRAAPARGGASRRRGCTGRRAFARRRHRRRHRHQRRRRGVRGWGRGAGPDAGVARRPDHADARRRIARPPPSRSNRAPIGRPASAAASSTARPACRSARRPVLVRGPDGKTRTDAAPTTSGAFQLFVPPGHLHGAVVLQPLPRRAPRARAACKRGSFASVPLVLDPIDVTQDVAVVGDRDPLPRRHHDRRRAGSAAQGVARHRRGHGRPADVAAGGRRRRQRRHARGRRHHREQPAGHPRPRRPLRARVPERPAAPQHRSRLPQRRPRPVPHQRHRQPERPEGVPARHPGRLRGRRARHQHRQLPAQAAARGQRRHRLQLADHVPRSIDLPGRRARTGWASTTARARCPTGSKGVKLSRGRTADGAVPDPTAVESAGRAASRTAGTLRARPPASRRWASISPSATRSTSPRSGASASWPRWSTTTRVERLVGVSRPKPGSRPERRRYGAATATTSSRATRASSSPPSARPASTSASITR